MKIRNLITLSILIVMLLSMMPVFAPASTHILDLTTVTSTQVVILPNTSTSLVVYTTTEDIVQQVVQTTSTSSTTVTETSESVIVNTVQITTTGITGVSSLQVTVSPESVNWILVIAIIGAALTVLFVALLVILKRLPPRQPNYQTYQPR